MGASLRKYSAWPVVHVHIHVDTCTYTYTQTYRQEVSFSVGLTQAKSSVKMFARKLGKIMSKHNYLSAPAHGSGMPARAVWQEEPLEQFIYEAMMNDLKLF